MLDVFRFYICHESTFGRCNFCGSCVYVPCCNLTEKVFKARCSMCSGFTFATKAPLAGVISADVAFCLPCCKLAEKVFKASCSMCSGFTFATKAPLAGVISADVAFCLPCFKKQRHQTLNAIGTHCNYRHVHGNFVAVGTLQGVAKK